MSKHAHTDMQAKRLTWSNTLFELPSRLSKDDVIMYCLESTFLNWNAKFDPRAKERPAQVKEASVKEATTTPETMGNKAKMLSSDGTVPRSHAENTAVKNGSSALMVCVKETATAPKLAFVSKNPIK
mmetsp:Transcript_1828/g.4118  ORF Transcript_1828/g.4118 Transcript_1828/m.4118 type:complete len:127 (-) Transcript_1828:179-559(-)